jgi:transposase InsO family protein
MVKVDILVRLGDDNTLHVYQSGTATLVLDSATTIKIVALYVPEFRLSLLSVSQLAAQKYTTMFTSEFCLIYDVKKSLMLRIPPVNGLYRFTTVSSNITHITALITTRSGAGKDLPAARRQSSHIQPIVPEHEEPPVAPPLAPSVAPPSNPVMASQSTSQNIWHRRFAHLHLESLRRFLPAKEKPEINTMPCDVCVRSKHQQHYIRTPAPRSTTPFELVHSDLCGPMAHYSLGGKAYYIIYIDDFSRWCEVYFLNGKSADEIVAKFEHYKARIEAQGFKIKRFRCDNGKGEFSNDKFLQILAKDGISFEPSPPYTQHKNGVAERMIRTINTKTRSLMIDSGIHMSFWAEALQTAVYLHQRTPTTSLSKYRSPYEVLHQKQPKIEHLRCFGCVAYKYIPKEQRDKGKFTERSKPCMMLGYVHDTAKIWRIWDFEIKKAVECSNVIFNEDLKAYEAIQQERIDPDQIVFPQTDELEIIEIPEMSGYERKLPRP